MNKNKFKPTEILPLLIGELAVALLTLAGYFIYDLFPSCEVNYLHACLGLLLGITVTTLNYTFMVISLDRAVARFMELRGTREMTEEEADKFTAENQMIVQNAIKTSFILRTVTMLATLVVAFLVSIFAPIATVIPLLAYRPIVTLAEQVKARISSKGDVVNPEFCDITSENQNEKESDD